MSRYDNRNLNRILHEFVNSIHSEKEYHILDNYKKVLSRVEGICRPRSMSYFFYREIEDESVTFFGDAGIFRLDG